VSVSRVVVKILAVHDGKMVSESDLSLPMDGSSEHAVKSIADEILIAANDVKVKHGKPAGDRSDL
jgi:hypothetical protein